MEHFRGGIVDVDLSRLDDEAEHVDVVLPRRVLRAIDSYAERQGETRNGFLAHAALDQMRRETEGRAQTPSEALIREGREIGHRVI